MKIIEDKNFLDVAQKQAMESHLFSPEFPYYYQPGTVDGDEHKRDILSHVVIRRIEERKSKNDNGYNSKSTSFFVDLLKNFCKKHKIKYKNILRCAVNLSYNNGYDSCEKHTDHDFPHKQLIVFLNDCDKNAYLFIEDNKKILKIKPEKYKGVCFDGQPHYFKFPKSKIRLVVVFTFN